LGIDLHQRQLPVDPQVAGACRKLGLDPLYVANEGLFIAVVAEKEAAAVLAHLGQQPQCENAAIIGNITEEHPRKTVLTSSIGGKRVVNMLAGEQLPRIC